MCSPGYETLESPTEPQRQSMKDRMLDDTSMIADTTLQTIIPASIIETIANRVAEIILDRIRPLLCSSPNTDEIFDVKGLAAYLKTTQASVREQARNGKIPCFKSGKKWKFHKRQIDKFFQSRALLQVSTSHLKGR